MYMKYYYKIYYRCVVATEVFNSLEFDEVYNSYNECLKAAKECEDKDHFALICTIQ